MSAQPAKHRQPWTSKDEEKLRRLFLDKQFSVREIAHELGRTEAAIRSKLRELNLSFVLIGPSANQRPKESFFSNLGGLIRGGGRTRSGGAGGAKRRDSSGHGGGRTSSGGAGRAGG